jgi:hypothetical protein
MNERIRELAEQALIHANKTWDPESDPNIFVKIAMEKHAELIVQECVKIAYQNDVAKFTRDGYMIGQEIEKHFGVEE